MSTFDLGVCSFSNFPQMDERKTDFLAGSINNRETRQISKYLFSQIWQKRINLPRAETCSTKFLWKAIIRVRLHDFCYVAHGNKNNDSETVVQCNIRMLTEQLLFFFSLSFLHCQRRHVPATFNFSKFFNFTIWTMEEISSLYANLNIFQLRTFSFTRRWRNKERTMFIFFFQFNCFYNLYRDIFD